MATSPFYFMSIEDFDKLGYVPHQEDDWNLSTKWDRIVLDGSDLRGRIVDFRDNIGNNFLGAPHANVHHSGRRNLADVYDAQGKAKIITQARGMITPDFKLSAGKYVCFWNGYPLGHSINEIKPVLPPIDGVKVTGGINTEEDTKFLTSSAQFGFAVFEAETDLPLIVNYQKMVLMDYKQEDDHIRQLDLMKYCEGDTDRTIDSYAYKICPRLSESVYWFDQGFLGGAAITADMAINNTIKDQNTGVYFNLQAARRVEGDLDGSVNSCSFNIWLQEWEAWNANGIRFNSTMPKVSSKSSGTRHYNACYYRKIKPAVWDDIYTTDKYEIQNLAYKKIKKPFEWNLISSFSYVDMTKIALQQYSKKFTAYLKESPNAEIPEDGYTTTDYVGLNFGTDGLKSKPKMYLLLFNCHPRANGIDRTSRYNWLSLKYSINNTYVSWQDDFINKAKNWSVVTLEEGQSLTSVELNTDPHSAVSMEVGFYSFSIIGFS